MRPQALFAIGALGITGLSMAGSAWAAGLSASRVNDPANITTAGNTVALAPMRIVADGDVISAGPRGKVALQFADGVITLSSLGDLQVFEAQTARGKQLALAKLKLLAGALRVDSRAVNGKAAQDVRLNVGSLKTRIINAHAWAANTAEGDTLCLLGGVVSVQTEGTGEERMATPGNCLRREPDGQLSRFAMESDAVVIGAIDATSFNDEAPATAVAVKQPAPVIATPAAAAAAPPPDTAIAVVPASEGPAAPAANTRGWTVVVLSLSRPEPVAARAQALAAQGLPAVTRAVTVNGMTMHRVAVGSFTSQAQARAYAASTLAKNGIKGWPAPL